MASSFIPSFLLLHFSAGKIGIMTALVLCLPSPSSIFRQLDLCKSSTPDAGPCGKSSFVCEILPEVMLSVPKLCI